MNVSSRARYVALFANESRSLLVTARRALEAWTDQPDEKLPANELFRALHTIKGMAASLEFTTLTELAHSLEERLQVLRDSIMVPGTDELTQLETGLDDLTAQVEAALEVEGAPPPETPRGGGEPRVVKVDIGRLDALFHDLGSLVTARQQLERRIEADPLAPVSQAAQRMAARLDQVQERILEVRLAPLAEVLERLPPMVRRLARQLGKEVRVEVLGGDIEVDRAILDQLLEPLMHLLRNSVDHGLENAAERRAGGKMAEGNIQIAARRERELVLLEIRDDGRGIDPEKVAAKAREMGLIAEHGTIRSEDLLSVLSRPGFTTTTQVTEVSGRGVGLDAVLAAFRAIGATVALATVPGKGTLFTLRLPTRIGIVPALVASVGNERYAIPLMQVEELVPCTPESILNREGRSVLMVRGAPCPVVDLRRLVLYRGGNPSARRPAVVLASGEGRLVVLVDVVHGQVEAVVQTVERPKGMPRWISGAAVLDGGSPVLLLDLVTVV